MLIHARRSHVWRTLLRSQQIPAHIKSQLLLGYRLRGRVPARCSITQCSYMRGDHTSGELSWDPNRYRIKGRVPASKLLHNAMLIHATRQHVWRWKFSMVFFNQSINQSIYICIYIYIYLSMYVGRYVCMHVCICRVWFRV